MDKIEEKCEKCSKLRGKEVYHTNYCTVTGNMYDYEKPLCKHLKLRNPSYEGCALMLKKMMYIILLEIRRVDINATGTEAKKYFKMLDETMAWANKDNVILYDYSEITGININLLINKIKDLCQKRIDALSGIVI